MQQPRLPSQNNSRFDIRKLAYFVLSFLILDTCPLHSIATANNLNKLRGMKPKHQVQNRQHKTLSSYSSNRKLLHPFSCSDGTVPFKFHVLTDNYGQSETSYSLLDENGAIILDAKVGNLWNNMGYQYEDCVPKDMCYVFTIKDEYGDGICCDYGTGSYSLLYDGVEVASGGDFGSMATHLIGCESWPLSLSPRPSLFPSVMPSYEPTLSLYPS
eukprot:12987975-Ditylum_brightwellii.AAC.1